MSPRIQLSIERYCDGLSPQVDEICARVRKLAEALAVRPEEAKACCAELHRMGGAALCMGFDNFGTLLKDLEALVDEFVDPPEDCRAELKTRILTLLERIETAQDKVVCANSSLLGQSKIKVTEDTGGASNFKLADERILYADDDRSMRELVRAILMENGARNVQVANNGRDAMDLFGVFEPTLLILDWQMRPISGMELLERVRGGKTILPKTIPIIFLTRENEIGNVRAAVQSGVNYFMVKPFRPDVLLRNIRIAVTRSRMADSGESSAQKVQYI